MATVAETISLLNQYNSLVASSIPQLSAIVDKIAAINPKDPNALATYESLKAERQTLREQLNAKNREVYDKYSAAFDSLTPSQKQQVDESSASATADRLFKEGTALNERTKKVLADKLAEIKSANPPPATPTINNTTSPGNAAPTGTNTLQGPSSDDSGSQPTTPTSQATTAAGAAAAGTSSPDSPSINSPSPPGTEREAPAAEDTKGTPPYENETFDRAKAPAGERPGKRLNNPLGSLASYTYQLTLYMMSPDAYDAFIASGRRNINVFREQFAGSVASEQVDDLENRGVFVVAQSGGSSTAERTPEFKYDYYIDDLSFKHLVNTKATSSSTGNITFNFKIVEPYGFSLITNLKKAQNRIRSTTTNNPTKQFFMLGIRFYGWDQSGRQVKGNEVVDGNPLDFNASGTGAIFETFHDLVVHEIKYKIDGKATTYNFRAESTSPSYAVNLRKGMINTSTEVSGSTVREMLSGPKGLITKLNEEQANLKKNNTIGIPTVYKIKWIADAEQMAIASVVSETRTNKSSQAGNSAKNTDEVNEQTALNSSPNNTQQRLNFSNTPITQAIDQIIARSKYIEDAMVLNYEDKNQANPETKSFPSKNSPNNPFKWFRITPEISNIEWDEDIKDWAFTITYRIETYLVPVIDNPYIQNNVKYYGPHKRYNYWYTGQNTEIISYEQTLNNAYFVNVLGGSPKNTTVADSGNKEGNASSVPGQGTAVLVNTPGGGDKNGSQGTPNMAAVNSVRTTLYDPGSFATAKISILGDPDYLMQEVATGSTGLNKAYSRFYSDGGFTINPTGGQVFIEIDFKEGVDYSSDEFTDLLPGVDGLQSGAGTLAINDSILFWDYNPDARKIIKGISYSLISVTNSFKNGAFTQTLSAVINDFGSGKALSEEARVESAAEAAGNTPQPEAPKGATGTTTDKPVNDPPPGNSSNTQPSTTATTNLDNAG